MKRLSGFVGSLAILLLTANTHAAMMSLSDLAAGGSLTVGDKLFDDWDVMGNHLCPAPGPACGTVDISKIMVEGIGDGSAGNEYGLQFSATDDAWTQIGDSFLDLFFAFSVTALDPTMKIVGSSMEGVVDIGTDSEWIIVEKDILNFDTAAKLAFMSIESDSLLMFEDLDASASFAGQSKIWVRDNVFIDGLDGSAQLISLTQRFMQETTSAVPAPGTVVLFAIGLLGASLARRRRPLHSD